MEVKTILSKIRQKEVQPTEYYFALEIGSEFIKSAIFSIIENQIKVLSLGSVERWENKEELIEAVDASLSAAAEKLPVEGEIQEPDRVVFGLPFNWVEGDKITGEKLKLLKKLSEKLDLKPAGFVVITEAIVHHLKTTEGVPATAIIVSLGLEKIKVCLVRIGKILGPKLIDKSESLADDLIEGLSRFEAQEPLPARILLYNGEEKLEEAKQQLINYPWTEKKKKTIEFLHLPKVEILPFNFDIEAIALAGGKEVAKAAGLVLEEKPVEKKPAFAEAPANKEEEKKEGEEVEEKEPVAAEALAGEKKPGFVPAGSLGFVKGEDVAEKIPFSEPEEFKETKEEAAVEELPKKEEFPQEEEPPVLTKETFFAKAISFRPNLSGLRKFDLDFLKKLIPKTTKFSPLLILIIAILVILIGGAFAAYWYLPRAEVILYLEPEILSKEFTITLDPSASVPDKEEFVLPAKQAEAEVEGKKSRTTTGSKDVGDQAKGEATIYNGTSNEKTFNSGIKIKSMSGLEFTLDDKVTVASQSSAADPPGKAVVKITAAEIGTEGNLAAGTEFTVANYAKSDYVAKNESAFSGGISRQIQAVSEEDKEVLLADLEASLEKEAKKKLLTQLSSDSKLIEESITSKAITSKYSHGVGEEANSLELFLKLLTKGLVYTEQELRELVEDSVLESVSEGFEYDPEETEFSFELGKVDKKGKAKVETHLKTKLIPQLDLEQIRNNLAGKYFVIGETYLGNLPRTTGFEAKITPRLPGRLGTFPRIANRIEVQVEVR